jgi:hypothetical protein
LRDRATACKLVPQKDINVYCKDANRRGGFPNHWFGFLVLALMNCRRPMPIAI